MMLGLAKPGGRFSSFERPARGRLRYLTIGQYLQPSAKHSRSSNLFLSKIFGIGKKRRFDLGFERVASGRWCAVPYFADALHAPNDRDD